MRIVKILLYTIAIILAIALVLGLMGKGEFNLSRSTTIKASKAQIWSHMASFTNMDAWNPWNSLDTAQVKTFPTEDGKVGSKYSWKGNDNVGEGLQTILYMAENDSIGMNLVFTAPWKDSSGVGYKLKGEDGNVTVTQNIVGNNSGLIEGIMYVLMGKSMMTEKFDEGLAKLKELAEKGPAAGAESGKSTTSYNVEEVAFPGLKLAVNETKGMKFSTFTKTWFEAEFGKVGAYIGANKLNTKQNAYQVTKNYSDKPEPMGDVYVGMDVDKDAPAQGSLSVTNYPAAKALRVVYYGKYEETMAAYIAIDKYAKEKKLTQDYAIEHYVTDPKSVNGDMSKVRTDIWMVLK